MGDTHSLSVNCSCNIVAKLSENQAHGIGTRLAICFQPSITGGALWIRPAQMAMIGPILRAEVSLNGGHDGFRPSVTFYRRSRRSSAQCSTYYFNRLTMRQRRLPKGSRLKLRYDNSTSTKNSLGPGRWLDKGF